MENKTIELKYEKIDDENFKMTEVLEKSTDINYKKLFVNMESYKKNLETDIGKYLEFYKSLGQAVEQYNKSIENMIDAKEKLWYDYDIPEFLFLNDLIKKIDGESRWNQ